VSARDIFPRANTIACIEESKLLKQFQYEILYNARGLQATLDELNGMNYFQTYLNAETDNYKTTLDVLMDRTFAVMRDIVPFQVIWRIFALMYDIHNMKLVVKERFFGKKIERLALRYGSYSLPTIRSAAVRESDNILENETLTRGFFNALRFKDMHAVDFELDKTYFVTLKQLAAELNKPDITAFIADRIDLYNFSVFFQWRAAGRPAGYFEKAFSDQGSCALEEWQLYIHDDERNAIARFPLWQKYRKVWGAAEDNKSIFYEFDVLADNYLIQKTKACKLMAFGVEPICAYFYNKFIEIKNIRILLTGKENEYGTDEIVKRMRIPYEL